MTEAQKKSISKKLSLVLRHRPEAIRIELDENGWIETEVLLRQFSKHFQPLKLEQLEEVVATNNKKRFAFNEDGSRIRASQGHSVKVELGYEPVQPPEYLYHGTATKNLQSILKGGIVKGKRHHVHLSVDKETATNVGTRHGQPVILTIRSGEMHRQGSEFFCSENGVWLTESISPEFIEQ